MSRISIFDMSRCTGGDEIKGMLLFEYTGIKYNTELLL